MTRRNSKKPTTPDLVREKADLVREFAELVREIGVEKAGDIACIGCPGCIRQCIFSGFLHTFFRTWTVLALGNLFFSPNTLFIGPPTVKETRKSRSAHFSPSTTPLSTHLSLRSRLATSAAVFGLKTLDGGYHRLPGCKAEPKQTVQRTLDVYKTSLHTHICA